ncbi:uncharacterized protein MYCFIDRAFT_31072 [Pseudocercospora fijiensis CIRAD86]|uniref:AB hydrolase-1 domain-containing protein n=1 Tax=Pseudocercospora fijiensis (strain CIRAD86) TaxID=383855 RepID=M2ZHR4_PSEFD|nr:uncharacterized protein MYCFIDRAFT_31072 [Pseudocercospora fijiensis CIRAD86]EME78659.1 hypothetical protein MYCFIDRAFT_31072 [Pseudocercospora fijiensis CIRAD86]
MHFTALFTNILLACWSIACHAAESSSVRNVTTSDGVRLAVIQAGPANGHALLFIPGWRQTAAQWKKQVEHFSQAGYRVTAYDYRGHGDSEKPHYGYRLSRFGADLKDILTGLDLRNVTIIAHSMGSSVTWALWDQYPKQRWRMKSFVIADQCSVLVQDPTWTQAQRDTWSCALFEPSRVYTLSANLSSELRPLITSMFTKEISQHDLDWMLAQNLKMSDSNAATLLINHASADWRDLLPTINIPTKVLSGAVSINNATGINWAATQIPGATTYTFTAEELGSHFVFWENPKRFNQIVQDFISS